MSEFEDTGSEEGNNEQGCSKSESGSGKKENDNKDIREKEGDQICDSQQNEVSVVNENGSDGQGRETPDQGDGGTQGQKSQEESQETEVADSEEENSIDKISQRGDLVSESFVVKEREHHEKAENTKKVDEASDLMVEAQTDISAKQGEQPRGKILNKSEACEQGHGEEENLISALTKKSAGETSVHESEQSEKSQELSSAVQVQVKVTTLVSETHEKTLDFTAQSNSRTALVNEGKQHSHTEPKHSSKSDATKGEDKVAKSIQDASRDSNKDQDKESSLKSVLQSLPEVESPQPNTGDQIKESSL